MTDELFDPVTASVYRLAFGMLDLSNVLLGLAEEAAACHDALICLHEAMTSDYDESEAAA